jgi:arylsulfatase A-like enzyme
MPDAPNVVVVMADDHGQWCAGPYGNDEVRTPAMDYLANTGVVMENAFCPSPVCSPARASFFTGRRPSQHGIHDWLHPDESGPQWLAGEVTLPELLADAGYDTGLSGKWHCGEGYERRAFDLVQNMRQGDWERPKFSVARDRKITDGAIDFLRRDRAEDPFFLFVGYTATHGPHDGEPPYLVEQYRDATFEDVPDDVTYPFGALTSSSRWPDREARDEARAQYYAAVESIDAGLGRLLQELDRQDDLEDTIVVYTSDHGRNCGHHGLWGKGNATQPPNVVEESIRVPLLLGGTTDVFPNQRRTAMVDHCDLFETVIDVAGVRDARPDDRPYPGSSYAPLLFDAEPDPDWRSVQICEYGSLRMARTQRYKLVRRSPDGPDECFDLEDDPRETTDVIDDPDYRTVVDRLDAALDDAFDGPPPSDGPSHNPLDVWRPGT